MNLNAEWLKKKQDDSFMDEYIREDLSVSSLPVNMDVSVVGRPMILQIMEVVDISVPDIARRNMKTSKCPTNKLLLSDGFKLACGVTKDFSVPINLKSGTKIRINAGCKVFYRCFVLTMSLCELMSTSNELFTNVDDISSFTIKKSGEKLLYDIEVVLCDHATARIDPKLAERLIGISPTEWIKTDEGEQNNLYTKLINAIQSTRFKLTKTEGTLLIR